MARLLFGTAGAPHNSKPETTVGGIRRIAELGLGCMEVEFVQGVRMGEAGANLVAEAADEAGVKLSVHAPYYINLNSHEPDKIRASQARLTQSAQIGTICGAGSIAFHSAFYMGDPPEKVYSTVRKNLSEVLVRLRRENNRAWIRPEVMGKPSQFGTIEEILSLSTELEGVAPCIDFSHWHARTGASNSYAEFASVLEQVRERLGRDALDNMHMHVSGIAYGKKGELKHLNLKESDFRYGELMRALKDYEVKGFVVCESPNLEEDALLLQETYNGL